MSERRSESNCAALRSGRSRRRLTAAGRAGAQEGTAARGAAAVTSGLAPLARSCSSRASSTQMVVLNDDRWSHSVPRSSSRHPAAARRAAGRRRRGWQGQPRYPGRRGAGRPHLPVNARLDLACKEGIASAFLRATSLPRHPVSDEAHRPARLGCSQDPAPGLAAEGGHASWSPTHGSMPPAPPAVGPLQGQQPRAPALGSDPCALGRDLVRGRTDQVAITCQRIDGSKSSSQRMTDWLGFGICRLGGLVAICCFSFGQPVSRRRILRPDTPPQRSSAVPFLARCSPAHQNMAPNNTTLDRPRSSLRGPPFCTQTALFPLTTDP